EDLADDGEVVAALAELKRCDPGLQRADAAHTGLSRMGETPIREIQKAALKDSQADDRQGIDCHEKGQWPFQPIFPLSPKSSLAGWLDGLSASIDQIYDASCR